MYTVKEFTAAVILGSHRKRFLVFAFKLFPVPVRLIGKDLISRIHYHIHNADEPKFLEQVKPYLIKT